MTGHRRFLTLVIIFLIKLVEPLPVGAEGALLLTAAQDEYPLGRYLELLEDPGKGLTLEEVTSPAFDQRFAPSQTLVPQFGYTTSAHWARFQVKSTLDRPAEWYLEVGDATLDSVQLYAWPQTSAQQPPTASSGLIARQTGDLFPRATRDVDHHNVVFKLLLAPQQIYTIYLRVENRGSTPLWLTLWSSLGFARHISQAQFVFGFFYGFIFIMVCYNLILFLFLQTRAYLYYVFTIANLGLYFATLDGLAAQYLWADRLWWTDVSILVFIGLALLGGLQFGTDFLMTKSYVPRLHQSMKILKIGAAVLIVLSLLPQLYHWTAQLLSVLTLLVVFLGIWAAFAVWRQGFHPAIYFLLAWGGVFLGAGFVVSWQFGLIPASMLTEYGIRAGIFLLVLLLSLALVDRINELRTRAETAYRSLKENEQLQQDILKLRQAEEKLRKLSRAVEQSASAIVITNLAGEIEFVNPAFSKITGYTQEEALGQNPRILKSNQNPPELYKNLWETITAGNVWQGELVNKKKNGEFYWEFATISPVKDKSGETTHYLAIKENITDRKAAQQTLQQRSRELALINHASQIFTSTIELDEVIQNILGEMHQLLDILATSYWLVVPETGELVCKQASGPGSDILIGWRLAPDQGITGHAARLGQPLIVQDTHRDTRHFKGVDEKTGLTLRSLMAIPLRVKGEVIGVLNLADKTVGRFSETDLALLEPVAAVAASAIKNAQLFDETQRQQKVAESLRQINTIINSSLDLETVLAKIFEQLQAVIQYDSSSLFLREGDDLVLKGGAALNSELLGLRIPLSVDNPLIDPFYYKKPFTIANTHTEPRWAREWPVSEKNYVDIRSWMGAPLLTGEQVLGVLTIDSFEVGTYTPGDAQTLQAFASQAAIAIYNAQQVKLTQEALYETQVLYRIGSTLAKTPQVQSGIETALGEFLKTLQLEQGGIILLDANQQKGTMYALYRAGQPQPLETQLVIFSKAHQKIIQTGKPLAIFDTLRDSMLADNSALSTAHNIKSMLLVPLLVRGEVIGLLGADSTEEYRHFTEREISLAQAIADQMATAIDNASLLKKEQQQRQMAESLRQVALALNSSLDRQIVISKILEQLRQVIQYDSAGLFLQDGDDLVLTGGANLDEEYMGFRIPIDSQVRAARVFRERQVMITPDVRLDPHWRTENTSGLILSWMAAPLLTGEVTIGVLTMDSFEVDTYSPQDAQVLQTFANQAAVAIQNAQLFDEAQRQRQAVEQALADLKATQNQLIVQEKMASLGMLTAGIAHEIKNPLNFVTSFAQLSIELAQELRDLLQAQTLEPETRPEIEAILDDLQSNAANITEEGYRANSIVQSMLLHSRGGNREPQETDLNSLLNEAVNLAFHSLRAKDDNISVTIETDYDPTLEPFEVIPQDLSRVFVNLVNNAYAAIKEKSALGNGDFEARLVVATKNLEDSVEICIRDNGLGISPAKQQKLFTPFFTTKPSGEGTGLGLSISYDIIVQQHRGAITVDSEVGEYTAFTIKLPKKGRTGETNAA